MALSVNRSHETWRGLPHVVRDGDDQWFPLTSICQRFNLTPKQCRRQLILSCKGDSMTDKATPMELSALKHLGGCKPRAVECMLVHEKGVKALQNASKHSTVRGTVVYTGSKPEEATNTTNTGCSNGVSQKTKPVSSLLLPPPNIDAMIMSGSQKTKPVSSLLSPPPNKFNAMPLPFPLPLQVDMAREWRAEQHAQNHIVPSVESLMAMHSLNTLGGYLGPQRREKRNTHPRGEITMAQTLAKLGTCMDRVPGAQLRKISLLHALVPLKCRRMSKHSNLLKAAAKLVLNGQAGKRSGTTSTRVTNEDLVALGVFEQVSKEFHGPYGSLKRMVIQERDEQAWDKARGEVYREESQKEVTIDTVAATANNNTNVATVSVTNHTDSTIAGRMDAKHPPPLSMENVEVSHRDKEGNDAVESTSNDPMEICPDSVVNSPVNTPSHRRSPSVVSESSLSSVHTSNSSVSGEPSCRFVDTTAIEVA